MRDDLFQKNLQRWSLVCPEGISKVEKCQCAQVNFCHASTGALNLIKNVSGKSVFLHSSIDPAAEADKWFSSLDLKNIDVIFVYGIGLGYCYEAAKEWLKAHPERCLVFFEDDPEIVHRFLESDRAKNLLHDPQVALYLFDPSEKGLLEIANYTTIYSPYSCIATALSETPEFLSFKSLVSFFIVMNRSTIMEYSQYGTVIFKNFFRNYLDLPRAYLANHLIGKFKNVPAIICGAGPSLDLNIDVLSTLHDRALIFAGGSAINALNARGVMPHFGAGIDPNPAQFTRLVMNQAYETPFFYRGRMLHEALEIIHSDRLYVTGSGGYDLSKWMEDELGISELGISENELDEGFNVLNFSLALAHALGCNPIFTVGVDLAYSQGSSYASGIISHPIHDRKDHFRTKGFEEELICKPDINGNPVYTLWKWVGESTWYANFAARHPDVTLINATEGGIGFGGVKNMPLSDVRDIYLIKSFDMSTLVHGGIQNSHLSKKVNSKNIKALLLLLADSLRSCAQKIEKIIVLLSQQKEKKADVLNQLEVEEGQLKDESAYKAMLKVFDQYYSKIHGVELLRLKLDADSTSANEQLKIAFDIKRYDYIRLTAEYNASIIQSLLNERANEEALINTWKSSGPHNYLENLKAKYPLPQPDKKDVYKFEHQDPSQVHMTVIDSEMSLHYNEKFTLPSDKGAERFYYENGVLKSEHFYLGGLLHGPSMFYAEDGTLLAKTWFINGKREGKKWTYYPNGSVHSLQRFIDGKEHGVQEYFYPNGIPKSIFSFNNGVMDGEVLLYHSQGQTARELTFVLGKREGTERIWDERGMLRIEANYQADRPVKTARTWHSNGVLSSEMIYDNDSKRIEIKEWDINGTLRTRPEVKDDFFDAATKELSNLAGSLNDLVGALSALSFNGNEKAELEKIENAELSDMDKLRQEMARLSSIEQQIQKQFAFDDANPAEELWKNPGTRREMEQQIEQAGGVLADSMKEIQREFKKLLDGMLPDQKPAEKPVPKQKKERKKGKKDKK